MKWFGESWGAPINDACDHVPTPVGELCQRCNQGIVEGDQGFILPSIQEDGSNGRVYYHAPCLLGELGISK